MMFSTLSLGLALLPLLHAATIDVVVGGASGLVYTPSNTTAVAGDTIVFHFEQQNHTATQSSFDSPCSPLASGFTSGFKPVAAGVTDNFPTYNVSVKDTNPIWVYCAQGAHCKAGMVFAVNAPTSGQTFDAFKKNAMTGTSVPSTASGSSASTGATSTPTTSNSSGVVRHDMKSFGTICLALMGAASWALLT